MYLDEKTKALLEQKPDPSVLEGRVILERKAKKYGVGCIIYLPGIFIDKNIKLLLDKSDLETISAKKLARLLANLERKKSGQTKDSIPEPQVESSPIS